MKKGFVALILMAALMPAVHAQTAPKRPVGPGNTKASVSASPDPRLELASKSKDVTKNNPAIAPPPGSYLFNGHYYQSDLTVTKKPNVLAYPSYGGLKWY